MYFESETPFGYYFKELITKLISVLLWMLVSVMLWISIVIRIIDHII